MDCIQLARDKDKWSALVNTVMKLRVTQNFGKVGAHLAASQEGLSSME
jgi:hypothetical protein